MSIAKHAGEVRSNGETSLATRHSIKAGKGNKVGLLFGGEGERALNYPKGVSRPLGRAPSRGGDSGKCFLSTGKGKESKGVDDAGTNT